MLDRKKLRKHAARRRLAKLAIIADRLEDGKLLDKQDKMLAGLDDGWEGIRHAIIEIAGKEGEWAGYPLPVEHAELVVEPRHPLQTLQGATLGDKKEDAGDDPAGRKVVNHWRDHRGWSVYIMQDANGRATGGVVPCNIATARAEFILETLGASQAWSVEAEFTAMARLKTLVKPTAFRYYLLTGTFLETSERSRVTYLFRKGRPTLALAARGEYTTVLAALCLHPIGYYKNTYAGSMVPTDDVIAHLTMMRGDERKYWAKCNQHDPKMPEAGV